MPPEHWRSGDRTRARRLHAETEEVVWTPGAEAGNPLALSPLPDLVSLRGDPDRLGEAIGAASASLQGIAGLADGDDAQHKRALLASSLAHLAAHAEEGSLEAYTALLDALPAELGPAPLAREMAEVLRAEGARDPALCALGAPLALDRLFGSEGAERVRISVIHPVGLPRLDRQRRFLHRLSLALCAWAVAGPPEPPRPRGLLVIDGMQDLAPATEGDLCTESLLRLSALGRAHGLAIVFAARDPRKVDARIVRGCATHIYGLSSSPAVLSALGELVDQRGGAVDDIPGLQTGQFYVHSAAADHPSPIKTKIPMSLSASPLRPPSERTILARAETSRASIARG